MSTRSKRSTRRSGSQLPQATCRPTLDKTPGGRPPASFWDDLWFSVWGQIYRGDLRPKIQADVEKAMLDWASAHGHEPSHSTIRSRARKLFQALQDEGKNPGAG